jgi:Peptidase C13 family
MLAMLAPRSIGEWATAVAAALPFLVALWVALDRFAGDWRNDLALLMSAVVVYRAQRVAAASIPGSALRAVIAVACVAWLFAAAFDEGPEFWFPAETEATAGESDEPEAPGDAERALFRQADLIDAKLSQLAPETPGITDTWFVGFAGDGRQHVFDKEVRFVRSALADRIDLEGHAIELINTPDPDEHTPYATISGLRRVLAGLARRMNVDEDVLVLFLTSHGSEAAELTVEQDALPLDALRGADLRSALDEAGIRWRIVVISACHSASFIPHLEDPRTLVATASRADRTSMGCSEERELTYFGEALFRDALPESDDWLGALSRAREVVERHEREQNIPDTNHSEPQIFVGERMRAKLDELKFRRAG